MFHILMNDIYTRYKHGNSNDPKNFKTGWNENGNETILKKITYKENHPNNKRSIEPGSKLSCEIVEWMLLILSEEKEILLLFYYAILPY